MHPPNLGHNLGTILTELFDRASGPGLLACPGDAGQDHGVGPGDQTGERHLSRTRKKSKVKHLYQDPPTGYQLRTVRVQQPSTNSLLEGTGIDFIY